MRAATVKCWCPAATERPWLAAVAGALLAAGQATADDAARLSALLEAMQSYSAEFEQVVVGMAGQRLQATTGTVHLERPGRFRWETVTPHPELLVTDGTRLYVFDAELKQVTIQAVDEALRDAPAQLLIHGPAALKDHFGVAQEPGDDGALAFTLTPTDERSLYVSVRLEFAAGRLRRLDITDHLDQATRITFSNARLNPPLPPATFHFEIPEGVDVIGHAAAG